MRNRIIGITGLSGSGKTTAARMLEKEGAYAVIADELSHNAILKGNPPYDAVVKAFGTGILHEETGEIDRRKLGAIVFAEPDKLKILEGIIHPFVIEKTRALLAEAAGKYKLMIIDAPMLIEAGMLESCGELWLVTAPDDLRVERIAARDGVTREAAAARLSLRGEDELRKYADVIITNGGSLEDLKKEVCGYAGEI